MLSLFLLILVLNLTILTIKDFWQRRLIRHCESCGYTGRAMWRLRGNMIVELLLWIFIPVLGIVYSFWWNRSVAICPECDSNEPMVLENPPDEFEQLCNRNRNKPRESELSDLMTKAKNRLKSMLTQAAANL